jgi:hypothetical protein
MVTEKVRRKPALACKSSKVKKMQIEFSKIIQNSYPWSDVTALLV